MEGEKLKLDEGTWRWLDSATASGGGRNILYSRHDGKDTGKKFNPFFDGQKAHLLRGRILASAHLVIKKLPILTHEGIKMPTCVFYQR